MPWESILDQLEDRCADGIKTLEELPRSPECLKYMVRVHITVDEQDLRKTLRQLGVRPYVVLQLLYFLIDQGHVAFRGKGRACELKQRMREALFGKR